MNDELIAQIVSAVMARLSAPVPQSAPAGIPVEVSGRHVHLSPAHFEALFGKGTVMEKAKDVSQPGQFLSTHRVRLIGPKGVIDRVAVLGPPRKATQVEISLTDAAALGISPPVRQSGDTQNSADIHIQAGETVLFAPSSVIVAARHLHMTPADAITLGVETGRMVDVLVEGSRAVILRDVLVRADASGALGLHIDFDEANAAGVSGKLSCRIVSLNLNPSAPAEQSVKQAQTARQVEYRLAAAAGKPALVTGRLVEDIRRDGVQSIRAEGKTIVTAQARDAMNRHGITIRFGG